jgi:hypothetical protein
VACVGGGVLYRRTVPANRGAAVAVASLFLYVLSGQDGCRSSIGRKRSGSLSSMGLEKGDYHILTKCIIVAAASRNNT